MADYPDWVLKYKTKGIYIKKTKSGYSLYRGHSERIEGKKYPILKCDEYLGIVTEKDGLIPSRPPVKPKLLVRTYGLEYMAESCCSILRLPLRKKGQDEKYIYSHALLSFQREDNVFLYASSILSLWYGDSDYGRKPTFEEEQTIERLRKQIRAKFVCSFGEEWKEAVGLLGAIYAVFVNERWVLSEVPSSLERILREHNLELRMEEKVDYGWKEKRTD